MVCYVRRRERGRAYLGDKSVINVTDSLFWLLQGRTQSSHALAAPQRESSTPDFSSAKPRSPRFTQDDGNLYVIRRHSTVSLPPPILTPITLHKKLKKMPQSRRKGIKRCGKWDRSRLHSIVFLSSASRHFLRSLSGYFMLDTEHCAVWKQIKHFVYSVCMFDAI